VVEIRWTTAFLDTPRRAPGADDVLPFWQQLTATRLSARRGDHQEFTTLLPADGDPFLRTQDSDGDTPGCHLDLHVHDVRAATDQAVDSGAELVADLGTLVLVRSPAGSSFCLVTHRQGGQRPKPVRFPTAGARAGSFGSLVDQLCIDVPAALFDSEVAWWSGLTGWLQRPGAAPEFAFLERPQGLPLRLLFQRLPQRHAEQPATAHLDFASTDRAAEVARHASLGAVQLRHTDRWDTMLDPVGRPYCITDRDPATGQLRPATGER
jgi:hypothetical protein